MTYISFADLFKYSAKKVPYLKF